MQILINKSGRSVRLTKRERDLLSNSIALLAELAVTGGGDIGRESGEAAEYIRGTLDAIDEPVINLQDQELIA